MTEFTAMALPSNKKISAKKKTSARKPLPCGSWPSSIDAGSLSGASLRLAEPQLLNSNGRIQLFYLEGRPQERGRTCIVQCQQDKTGHWQKRDITPQPINVRSKVNEYGGGHYLACDAGVFFSSADDQCIYLIEHGSDTPKKITLEAPEDEQYRYAEYVFDKHHKRLMCLREHHSKNFSEPQHTLVAVDIVSGDNQILAQGQDFYASPALSPCGQKLLFISWQHPDMPWGATQLHQIVFSKTGEVESETILAGQERNQAIAQPSFSPAGEIVYATDVDNWWQLVKYSESGATPIIEADQRPDKAEFAMPRWVGAMTTYAWLDNNTIITSFSQDGSWQLAEINTSTGELSQIDSPYNSIDNLVALPSETNQKRVAFIGAGLDRFSEVVTINSDQFETVAKSVELTLNSEEFSQPSSLSFGDKTTPAQGFFYPPHNSQFQALDSEKPPVIVLCHGGPTGATSAALNLKIQYWTSRGFAVLDVNYRGSTGFGRQFRQALDGQWGIFDVEDACAGVKALADKGLIDSERATIKGSSAGGYSVLAALAFTDTFKAGCSLYGIGDLETLAQDTHKFEARYLDSLVAPYPAGKDIYQARSPINHIEKLHCPVVFFQGSDDKVVPPNQAIAMHEALAKKGIATALEIFDGEGHGFRQAQNIERALTGELYFYGKVFGFEPAGDIAPLDIKNLTPSEREIV